MTLGEMADWWKHRGRARWESTDGRLTIVSREGPANLQAELVTGYGTDGFTSEILS
jgi:hypothetical protein